MGLSNAEIKKVNRNSILRYLLKTDIVSKNEIAYDLKLTTPTVTSALQDLAELGLIREEGAMDSNGGRRSMGFSCNKRAKYAVGVDVSKEYVDLAVIDLAMTPLLTKHEKVAIKGNEASYQWLRNYIDAAIDEAGLPEDRILGIGYALPAIIDESGQKIYGLHEEMDLPRDFYDVVKDWFPYPAVLQREAVSAAEAVSRTMDIEGPVVYLNLSPSIGGAVIRKGERIELGINCRKGEFGHITIVPKGKKCFCGRYGCVNAYCSTDNLTALTGCSLGLFFERLRKGEPGYQEIWDEYLYYLALTIHNLMTFYDEKVILGGSLSVYLPPYLDAIRARVAEYDAYLKDSPYLYCGTLRFDASPIGAAYSFVENYISRI